MMIFDFVTQDEMDDLPDDDPQSAFTRFVEIARRRLAEQIKKAGDDEAGWSRVVRVFHRNSFLATEHSLRLFAACSSSAKFI